MDSARPCLRVIGFEGSFEPADTPARAAPILADEAGRVVGHGGDRTGGVTGEWTAIDPSAPYRDGDIVLVVGPWDTRALRGTLLTTEILRIPRGRARCVGEVFALVCSEAEAVGLLGEIEKRAAAMIRGGRLEGRDLVDRAWWLSRCAQSDENMRLAVSALRQVDPEAADLLQREAFSRR